MPDAVCCGLKTRILCFVSNHMSTALLLHQHSGWECAVCWSSSVKFCLRTSTLLNLRATCTSPTRPPERWSRPQFSALMITSYVKNCVIDFKWENNMFLRDMKWILFAAQKHRAVFLPSTDCHLRITVSSFNTENHKSFQWTQLHPIGRNNNNCKHYNNKPDPSPIKFNILKPTFKESGTKRECRLGAGMHEILAWLFMGINLWKYIEE
jgi:hypothetical protein